MQKYTEAVVAWLVKCQVIEEQKKNYIAMRWRAIYYSGHL